MLRLDLFKDHVLMSSVRVWAITFLLCLKTEPFLLPTVYLSSLCLKWMLLAACLLWYLEILQIGTGCSGPNHDTNCVVAIEIIITFSWMRYQYHLSLFFARKVCPFSVVPGLFEFCLAQFCFLYSLMVTILSKMMLVVTCLLWFLASSQVG